MLTRMADDDQDEPEPPPPPMDPVTLVLVLYTFRLVHAWMHNLPTEHIQADLIEAACDHHLWRDEYRTDPALVPGAEPGPDDDGDDGAAKRPRLTLVE